MNAWGESYAFFHDCHSLIYGFFFAPITAVAAVLHR
jgi:hypothetical protein